MGRNLSEREIFCTRNLVQSPLFPEVLRFKLDPVSNDPIFGSAGELEGEIPFVRPTQPLRDFRAQLDTNPEIADGIARGIVSKYRDLWADLEDEEIFTIVRNQASSLLLVVGPETNGDVKRRDHLVQMLVLTFTIDRIFDKSGAEGVPSLDELDYADLVSKLRTQNEPDVEGLPSGLVEFEMMSKIANTAFAESEKAVPRWTRFYPAIRDDVIATITAHLVTFDLDRNPDGPRFSEETMTELRRAISGVKLIIGISAIFKDVDVPAEIRKDDLFQISVNRATDIAAVMNGILGLARDIRLQQIDSPITCAVAHDHVPLQEAFDASIKKIHSLYNDYVVASRKLVQLYKREPSVKQHVDLLDWFLDGMLSGYNCMELYGVHDKTKIVRNSSA